jgi:hypothetical protein
VLPLNQRGVRLQAFFIPRIGRNSVEGEYIKESVNYVWGDKDYGSLFLDYYRKIGLGYGLEHFYHFKDKGAGRLYYYTLGTSKTVANRYNLLNKTYYQFSKNLFASAEYSSERYAYPNYTSPQIRNIEFFARNFTGKLENIIIEQEGISINVTASFGIAFCDCRKTESIDDIISRADNNMYKAKSKRNFVYKSNE